jgi:hypothetical protein
MQFPIPQVALSYRRLVDQLLLQRDEWNKGRRFVRMFSSTVISEFNEDVCGGGRKHHVYNLAEFRQYTFTPVIFNVRAFDFLWGPSQQDPGFSPEVCGWPNGWADINLRWRWLLDAVSLISGVLRPVIMAPGEFVQIPDAKPTFRGDPEYVVGDYYPYFRGVYAARKVVAGTTYVGVINMEHYESLNIEVPVRGSSAEDLLGSGTRTIRGNVLREKLPPMGVRIYRIRP